MLLLLLLLLVALPIAELAVLVQVAGSLGVFETIGLLILVSIVGVWLAKREGLGVISRMRDTQARGEAPSRELADGALILLAAGLLVLPGFISDVVGILLLLPPVRALVRTLLLRRLRNSSNVVMVSGRGRGTVTGTGQGAVDVWDVDSWEVAPGDGSGDGDGRSAGARDADDGPVGELGGGR
jgi:UPF0716 protein FxsA